VVLPLLTVLVAGADPWSEAELGDARGGEVARAAARTEGSDVLLGRGRDDVLATELPPGEFGSWARAGTWRVGGVALAGDGTPDLVSGDEEGGLLGGRARGLLAARIGPAAGWIAPELGFEAVPGIAGTARVRGWAGLDGRGYTLGFGKRDRWIGPARHGALLRSDNAEPPWMGEGALEGRLPGVLDIAGRFRAEAGLGWLDAPRSDAAAPGLLEAHLRWSPHSSVEIGLGRLSIFGGEGRPPADLGQLLIPSEPHVYGDPEKSLPDQDELASVDIRLCAPLGRWLGGPVRYVEGWWEYGGEDLVQDATGLPRLAGVANTVGGEVRVLGLAAAVERSVLMDDVFRWYVGHRVYHDGFTQDGRVLGAPGGPDSATWWASLALDGAEIRPLPSWRARAWFEHRRRVGVARVQGDHVFSLSAEEERWTAGVDLVAPVSDRVSLLAAYAGSASANDDFVPGASALTHRLFAAAEFTVNRVAGPPR
jgi:hypothetical protein